MKTKTKKTGSMEALDDLVNIIKWNPGHTSLDLMKTGEFQQAMKILNLANLGLYPLKTVEEEPS